MVLDNGVMKQWSPAPSTAARVVSTTTTKTQFVLNNLNKLERIKSTNSYKICIQRKLGGFGDILMITPSLRGIKNRYPDCHLTFALPNDLDGQYLDSVKYNPYIDSIVPWPSIQQQDYDVFIDVTMSCLKYEKPLTRPPSRIDLFAEAIGVELQDFIPVYVITEEERRWAAALKERWNLPAGMGPNASTVYVGIQYKSQGDKRNWEVKKVKALIGLLTYYIPDCVVVLFMGHDPLPNWKIRNCIELRGFRWRETAAIVDAMDVMVVHDSGLLHLAAALNKKTVAIFGSTPSASRSDRYPTVIPIEDNTLTCRPCWYGKCDFNTMCLKNIAEQQVFDVVKSLIFSKEIKKSKVTAVDVDACLIQRDVGGFGDMITITPVIRELKRINPRRKLFLAVPEMYKCIFENNPHIDTLFSIKDKLPRVGAQYNLSSPCASYEIQRLYRKLPVDKSRIEVFADHCGLPRNINYQPEMFLTLEEQDWAYKQVDPNRVKIGIALRTSDGYRDWSMEYFEKLFGELQGLRGTIQLILFDRERVWDCDRSFMLDAMGYPFRKMAALAQQCQLLVTADTALLHLAGWLGTPTIALFGPIDSTCRIKHYPNVEVLYDKTLDCLPCWRNANIACRIAPPGSPLSYSQCMFNIKPTDVLVKIMEKLNAQ